MKRKPHAKFLLENLEPRLLLSADLALLPVDGGALSAATGPALEVALAPGHGTLAEQAITAATREVVFVDAGVEDYQSLVDDLAAQTTEGRLFDVVILDAGADGITQISTYLAQQQNVAAVHIVSHGASGEVTLGNTTLNLTTLDRYADQLEGWQQALTNDADLLFYGCDLAAGPNGQAFIDSLALLTGADVAASSDLTGAASLGGNWVLEYAKGPIEAAVAFSSQAQQSWAGTLVEPTFIPTPTPLTLGTMAVNAPNPTGAVGVKVSDFVQLGVNVSDDAGAQAGIAVTNTNDTEGRLWWSINNGITWNLVPAGTMNPKAEEARLRYLDRSLIVSGRLRLPLEAAVPLVGPDCAYHLYAHDLPRCSGPAEEPDGRQRG